MAEELNEIKKNFEEFLEEVPEVSKYNSKETLLTFFRIKRKDRLGRRTILGVLTLL